LTPHQDLLSRVGRQDEETDVKKMLQTRSRHSTDESHWRDEKVFGFNKYGELSSAGEKFLRSIDRDRHEIRWK
jgi:hypothetical protein